MPPSTRTMQMFKRAALLLVVALPLAAQSSFQPGRLPATSRDSFDVIYQGQPIGAFIMSHARAGDNVTLVTQALIPRMGVTEIDTLVFNATTLAPVLITNNQSMMGQSGAGRVVIANGKASGSMQQPGPGGMQTVNIDATVAPGVIADGAEAVMIPTLDFSDALTVNFQTFDGKSGKTKSYVLKVSGKETVTVPAGSIESWKLDIAGDEAVTIWVSVADPKKITMLRLEGAQMEMRRAK